MPVATRKKEVVRKELTSCPDGFVVLRQMSYDELLERRDGATRMLMERGTDVQHMAVQIANKWSNHFSFARCIMDHNLTDEDGTLLNFKKPEEAFAKLDPRVGSEIERYIDEMNNEEEPGPDFTPAQNGSLPDETIKLHEPSEKDS